MSQTTANEVTFPRCRTWYNVPSAFL